MNTANIRRCYLTGNEVPFESGEYEPTLDAVKIQISGALLDTLKGKRIIIRDVHRPSKPDPCWYIEYYVLAEGEI